MKKTGFSFLFIIFLSVVFCAHAQSNNNKMQSVSLPGFFNNNMVLQRGKPIKFWGTAAPGTQFTVNFANQNKTVKANSKGTWEVIFPAMRAGAGYELKINSSQPFSYTNIAIGDVWLTSGQSNMDFPFGNTDSVAWDRMENRNIRYYSTPTALSNYPQTDMKKAEWQLCTNANMPGFTAVGYYFAQKMNKELGVPIGIIHTSWGGTSIKAWTSEEGIRNIPAYRFLLDTLVSRRGTDMAIDSINQRNYAISSKTSQKIAAADKGYALHWQNGAQDSATWNDGTLPGTWQTGSFKNFDGVLWFRKVIDLPADAASSEYTIQYGKIMGVVEMYINGVKIGSGNYKRSDNKFFVRPGVITGGKNTLVVRVVDNDTAAAFYSPAEDLMLRSLSVAKPFTYSIAGPWQFATTLNGNDIAAMTAPQETAPRNTIVSSIYNVKIAPLLPLAIKGILWYQGENDAPVGYFYRTLFANMIEDWRRGFGQGNLPFLFVQLTSFGSVQRDPVENWAEWPDIRESQATALALPATAMAVSIDVGNPADIHPHNKKPVGDRLAYAALNMEYATKRFPECPLMESYKTTGAEMHIRFKNAGSGLTARGGQTLQGFAVAGADKKWVAAKARIVGKDEVIVSSDAVTAPVSVRYAWASSPVAANLINREGLPAGPFRTDSWTLKTEGKVDDKN